MKTKTLFASALAVLGLTACEKGLGDDKYRVTAYATKAGCEDSDTAIREIVINENGNAILVGDVDGDGKVNVTDHVKLSEIIMNQE